MRFGGPFSGWGEPENQIVFYEALANGPRIDVRLRARANFGNAYFQIYRNAKYAGTVFATEGVTTAPFAVANEPGHTKQTVVVLPVGSLSDTRLTYPLVVRQFEVDHSKRVTLRWDWPTEIIGAINENAKTSAWVLTGIKYAKTKRIPESRTRGYYDLDLEVSGANVTVTLRLDNLILASGTGVFPGVVTLTAQDSSGPSGNVLIAAGATTVIGARLFVRWPKQMKINRGS